MQIIINTKGFDLTEPLREYVEKHLGTAIERFELRLHAAHVSLEDVNGPKGGVDKRCRLHFTGMPGAEESLETMDADLHAAIDVAVEKAERYLAHVDDRRHPTQPDKSRNETIRKPGEGSIS